MAGRAIRGKPDPPKPGARACGRLIPWMCSILSLETAPASLRTSAVPVPHYFSCTGQLPTTRPPGDSSGRCWNSDSRSIGWIDAVGGRAWIGSPNTFVEIVNRFFDESAA